MRSFLIWGGIVLLSIGLPGILFSSSSIFFGFLTVGAFLTIYGLTVRVEGGPTHPAAPTPSKASLCPKCGARLEPEGNYCPNCGERVR